MSKLAHRKPKRLPKLTAEQEATFAKGVRLDRICRSLLKDYPARMFLRCGVSRLSLAYGIASNG